MAYWNPFKIDVVIQHGTSAVSVPRDPKITDMTVSAFQMRAPGVKLVKNSGNTLCHAFHQTIEQWVSEKCGDYLLRVEDDCIPGRNFWLNLNIDNAVGKLLYDRRPMIVSLMRPPWSEDTNRIDTTAVIGSYYVWKKFVEWSSSALKKYNDIADNTTVYLMKFLKETNISFSYTDRSLVQVRPVAGAVIDGVTKEKFSRDFSFTYRNAYLDVIKGVIGDVAVSEPAIQVLFAGVVIGALLDYSCRVSRENVVAGVSNIKDKERAFKIANELSSWMLRMFREDIRVQIYQLGDINAGGYDFAYFEPVDSYEEYTHLCCRAFHCGLLDEAPVVIIARNEAGISFIEDMAMLGVSIWHHTSKEMIAGLRRRIFGL